MLVVNRKRKESIIIGDGPNKIVVTIIDWRASGVRVGVQAPDDVAVNREEVYNVIKRAGGDLTTRPSGG